MNSIAKVLIATASITGLLAMGGVSAHATSQSACADGSKRVNLSVTWNSSKNVTVGTVGNKPLCADTTLYFSSYTMPDNYNGGVFANNPTASPQAIFDSTSVVLKKGATQPQTMEIGLPEACKNTQVDVYYGPEIITVDAKGHGSQYISGKILKKTQDECTPTTPEEPEVPEVPAEEAETPETPAPEVKVTPQMPAELPTTGSALANTLAVGAILSAATYAAVYVATKR